MRLEIDTTRKTITILEETPLSQILEFLQNFNTEDYKIASKYKEKEIQYVPYPNTLWIEPKYPVWIYDPNSQPFYTT